MKTRTTFILSLTAIIALTAGNAFGKYGGGTGEPNDPYQIADANNLLELAGDPNDYGKCFILTADINLTGVTVTPIAPDTNASTWDFQGTAFTGDFDGNDHVIRNAIINLPSSDFVGLFGYVGSGGQIKNLGAEDANITGKNYVGGLVGYNNSGSLTDCYATGCVTGTEDFIGGLVGTNVGNVTSCYATSSVSVEEGRAGGLVGSNASTCSVTSCYATGFVSGTGNSVGGLVGFISVAGSVTSCYATGSAIGGGYIGGLVGQNWQGKVIRCYSTGKPTGTSNVGGLCGGKTTGSNYEDTGNFWDTQTSQTATSAMGTGKTTAEMKTLSTFTSAGWDFVEIWGIGENQTYPYLRTEPAGDLNHDKKVDFADFAVFASHWLEGI